MIIIWGVPYSFTDGTIVHIGFPQNGCTRDVITIIEKEGVKR